MRKYRRVMLQSVRTRRYRKQNYYCCRSCKHTRQNLTPEQSRRPSESVPFFLRLGLNISAKTIFRAKCVVNPFNNLLKSNFSFHRESYLNFPISLLDLFFLRTLFLLLLCPFESLSFLCSYSFLLFWGFLHFFCSVAWTNLPVNFPKGLVATRGLKVSA